MSDELKALRVQDWLLSEHGLLVEAESIRQAMCTPLACLFTEADFGGPPVPESEQVGYLEAE